MELPTRQNSVSWIKDRLGETPRMPKFEGTGIVMIAGGTKYWTNAYASIRLLRDKGCQLPIQCWYLGEKEKNEIIQELLKEYNVECIDAHAFNESLPKEQIHTNLNGWEAVEFGIIHSKWKNVLYLDADVFVANDPVWIFDSEEFKKYGCIFFPDFGRLAADREIWTFCGVEYRDEPEVESGIIFIDKERCWEPLNLANRMCEVGTRFGWWGGHGNKEVLHMAWHVCHKDYFMIPFPIKRLAGTMVQHDVKGQRTFYHRNMKKLTLIQNDVVKDFANEDKLFSYLDDLRVHFNPFALPDEDPETNTLAGSSYEYHQLGIDSRLMTFGKNNSIIIGKQRMENSYSIKDGKLHLLAENGKITATLEKCSIGYIGRWAEHEKCVTLLVEVK